jgi:hypothetical protein
LKQSVSALSPQLNQISRDTIDGVVKELEDRAIGAGTVTQDSLATTLRTVLDAAGLTRARR